MQQLKITIVFLSTFFCAASSLFAQRNFDIDIYNNTDFDITALPVPIKGEGIFYPFNSAVPKKTTRHFTCKQDALLKGVEGHLKFNASNSKIPGMVEVYFSNPAVGDLTCTVTADWPYTAKFTVGPKRNLTPNAALTITADTTNYGPAGSTGMGTHGNQTTPQNIDEAIPAIINFEWKVTQRMQKNNNDDDDGEVGKAYKEITYLFTTNGDYAATKQTGEDNTMMVYTKAGNTLMINEKQKTIMVMSMPKMVGEGGQFGKALAEKINKAPIQKDKDDEKITITKTGKTKKIAGYIADEYEIKNNNTKSTHGSVKASTASFWYGTMPFNPIKIYTMGAGKAGDVDKVKNNPKMKNNIAAIPLMSKNYLWLQTEAGGKIGMETTEIKKVYTTIYTAGYKINKVKGLKDIFKSKK